MKSPYCVVYRVGGTENFEWRRTLATPNMEEAKAQQLELVRAGYHAFVEDYRRSLALGLPETFTPKGEDYCNQCRQSFPAGTCKPGDYGPLCPACLKEHDLPLPGEVKE